MPAENEELDVFKNRKWQPFVSTLRGAPSLHDELVLRAFDRCFIPSLRRACRLLKVTDLIIACINGNQAEVDRLRLEHRKQRDRAETFADQVVQSCTQGMSYRQAVDAFIHSACARVIDQAALAAVPSDNFPTIEDYRHASAVWLFRMEPRVNEMVDQFLKDPAKLKVERQAKHELDQRLDQQLGWSVIDPANKEHSDGGAVPNQD